MRLSQTSTVDAIEYPASDGKPMADNTKQARWIVRLYINLRSLFQGQEVFVAADLLWYPIQGNNHLSTAPDVMVVFGRPDGDRSSYLQWREEGIAPQVVFEIISPGNSQAEIDRKLKHYTRFGVEELIIIDPGQHDGEPEHLIIYQRQGEDLVPHIPSPAGWTSPRLGIHLAPIHGQVQVYDPTGQPFRTFEEVKASWQAAEARAEAEKLRAETERQRAEAEKRRAEAAEAELERLRARLRDLEG